MKNSNNGGVRLASEHEKWQLEQRVKTKSERSEEQIKEWRQRVNSGGGWDRKEKMKSNSARSETRRIEWHGITGSDSPVVVFILLCKVYYFAVAPTPASCYTHESFVSTCLTTNYSSHMGKSLTTCEGFVTLHVICTVLCKFCAGRYSFTHWNKH